ncbi:hypothetical protein Trydic_g10308 [Trypoxylus dichotomus]
MAGARTDKVRAGGMQSGAVGRGTRDGLCRKGRRSSIESHESSVHSDSYRSFLAAVARGDVLRSSRVAFLRRALGVRETRNEPAHRSAAVRDGVVCVRQSTCENALTRVCSDEVSESTIKHRFAKAGSYEVLDDVDREDEYPFCDIRNSWTTLQTSY